MANKNIRHPVKFEFQVNKEYFKNMCVPNIALFGADLKF